MDNPLPEYVLFALEEWETLAFFAYEKFEKHGPITIGIRQDDEESIEFTAINYDIETNKCEKHIVELLEKYDPEYEILIQYQQDDNQIRTQRIRTAAGGRHPRRIYFFEMMRRVTDEPENIVLEDLPEWLIGAFEKLEEIKKD